MARLNTFDMIIIGGGITGLAIAKAAQKHCNRVALYEQNTLGSGASSHSSKLAHGGLRYLENYQFKLVKTSLKERHALLKQYPHLVKPLPFIFPIFKHSPYSKWKIKLGLSLYDWLATPSPLPQHQSLSKHDITRTLPWLKSSSLIGGFCYYDAQMDDLGIINQLASHITKNGGHIATHTPVSKLLTDQNGQLIGVELSPKTTPVYQAFAPIIINATGAWSNAICHLDSSPPITSPSKGVHILTPYPKIQHGILLTTPQDKRVFFMLPWKGNTLIGTTDTPFENDPNSATVTSEDINYLITASNHYIAPHTPPITPSDIISTTVGLRPLILSHNTVASKRYRGSQVTQSKSGLWSIVGGKYTAHQHMADTLLKQVFLSKIS